ncbi:MAG: hypothetical protein WC979_08665 [Candidatus Pacearchaeota archaeon]|jgi:hypothetical protein
MIILNALANFDSNLIEPSLKEAFIASALGGMLGVLVGVALIITLLIFFSLYIYTAFAWMTIGKKLGCKKSWLAFIPIANLFLLPMIAKKHWAWGWWFLLPPVYFILAIIWVWQIYERRNYPGALSLLLILWILPIWGIGLLVNLVIFGFVAWKDRGRTVTKSSKRTKKKKSKRR